MVQNICHEITDIQVRYIDLFTYHFDVIKRSASESRGEKTIGFIGYYEESSFLYGTIRGCLGYLFELRKYDIEPTMY